MAPGVLKVPMSKDKQVVVPIKKQPRKSETSRVYEYVPDLELRLSIREGTYLRMNSRKHRDDELMLLVKEARMEKTPQMLAERKLARQIRIRKRMQAKMRTLARNQMLAAGASAPVVLQANAVVLNVEPLRTVRSQKPVALVVDQPMPAMLIERPVAVAVAAETMPVVADQVVNARTDLPRDVPVKAEPLDDQAAIEKAENLARKAESAKRARAAKAAKADKQEQNGEPSKAAAQPKVPARAVVMPPWLRPVHSEASATQAIAAPVDRASTNGYVVSGRESSLDEEMRAANMAMLRENADKMPGVRVEAGHGRRIEGSLMKWWDGHVLICCHCHGSILSPNAFVVHAGHVDVKYPLKRIRLFSPTSLTL